MMLREGHYASIRSGNGFWHGRVVEAPRRINGPYRIRVGGTDDVVTVPWNRVGMHSTFARMRSRKLSARSNAKIDAILADEELCRLTTCTAVMKGVVERLGDPKRIRKNFPLKDGGPDGIYALVINFTKDLSKSRVGWEHGLAYQKCGNQIVLYQGWVETFSLGDWLMLTPKCLSLRSSDVAPRHPSYGPDAGRNHVKQVLALPDTWQAAIDKSDADAAGAAMATIFEALFGPRCNSDSVKLKIHADREAPLTLHWHYAPFANESRRGSDSD